MPDNITELDASNTVRIIRTKENPSTTVHTQQMGNEAATQVDGHSVTIGSTTDTRWDGSAVNATLMALLKDLAAVVRSLQQAEDTPNVNGAAVLRIGAVRRDVQSTLVDADG